MTELTETGAWKALQAHYAEVADLHLRDLFAADPTRGETFTAEGAGLYLDYSKNRITAETVRLLLQLAAERDVAGRRDAMLAGEHINVSEDRAVLHTALRLPRDAAVFELLGAINYLAGAVIYLEDETCRNAGR